MQFKSSEQKRCKIQTKYQQKIMAITKSKRPEKHCNIYGNTN